MIAKTIKTIQDFNEVFHLLERTLKHESNHTDASFLAYFEPFKHIKHTNLSNQDYFNVLVKVIFYSGYKASEVDKVMPAIVRTFNNFEKVANFAEDDLYDIIGKDEIINNRKKLQAIVDNAKTFTQIIKQHGSIERFIKDFDATASDEKLFKLVEALQRTFVYLGPITVYHFLTDIGFRVLKPDRVIMRIFYRLGFIPSEKHYLEAIFVGRKFAEATGYPIRYIDIILVSYGQLDLANLTSICTTLNPKCHRCGVKAYCLYANGGLSQPILIDKPKLEKNQQIKKQGENFELSKDISIQNYQLFIKNAIEKFGMTLKQSKSDPTLYSIFGGKLTLQFSIRPSKMVSVWQINDTILQSIPYDYSSLNPTIVAMKLNRRLTIPLDTFAELERKIIAFILETIDSSSGRH